LVARDTTRLHNLEQMRKDFVANVSHELRTPLTVVVGYLETLQDSDEPLSPRWKRALQQMQQQAKRMQSLLNDLLMLARLETTDESVKSSGSMFHACCWGFGRTPLPCQLNAIIASVWKPMR